MLSEPSGRTRVAAVIGDPVHHSLSPAIHNAAFAERGLDWLYVALPVGAGHGADAVEAMKTLHLAGLSVTMPHKAAVLGAVDRVTEEAAVLGAANCLAWEGDRVVAHNTDGPGFLDSLRAVGFEPAGRSAVVLGAGGAARAVVHALGRAGAGSVRIVNRTLDRAVDAAALAPTASVGSPEDAAEADLVVNATPVGMGRPGGDAAARPLPAGVLSSGQTVVDLVYDPVRTALLAEAAAVGAVCVDGVGMLVHQAAHAFGHWTGLEAPVEVMRRAAERVVAARG